MEEKLTLSPEQLFFLGTLMDAEYINYDYIAAMSELQRNYTRTRRKCLDDLTQAGILRQRLSGEVSLRPTPKKMLEPLFFGKKEWDFEIFTLAEESTKTVLRFHQSEQAITCVQQQQNRLLLSESSFEELDRLTTELAGNTQQPKAVSSIQKDAVTRIIVAKQAEVGRGSASTILFEQFGGLYIVDEKGEAAGIPASRAKAMLLDQMKGI